ncbi:MAG TPA: serine hydrolase, partial [Candidatus Polarisedimenticolaceae bacterium]|nr:serine hydrolase [Candidatus Polarisedimenticolaceae bacterium]
MRVRHARFGSSIVVTLVAVASAASAAPGADPGSGPWLQYSMVELAGFDPAKLEQVRRQAEAAGSGALLVVRNGSVVVAWGDVERKFKCHSVRKSFLSALYGQAVARGEIDLAATLGQLGIDDREPLSAIEKQATVEQLIQARSGVYHPAAKEPGAMKEDRPVRGSRAPGEAFWYNNWDFNTA